LFKNSRTEHRYLVHIGGLSELDVAHPDVAGGRELHALLQNKIKVQIILNTSIADPGCLTRIPDPNFFHSGSWISIFSIPDPEFQICIKEFLSILIQKIVYNLSEI
jgi:hypothetical protein